MSRTYRDKPFKFTEIGKKQAQYEEMYNDGLISLTQYRVACKALWANIDEHGLFARPPRAKFVQNMFNRRDRRIDTRLIKASLRGNSITTVILDEIQDCDDTIFLFRAVDVFEPIDEKPLDLLPTHKTGKNQVWWWID